MTTATRVMSKGNSRIGWIAVTVVLTIIGFLATPHGPLGFFWRPAPGPEPTAAQLPFFMLLNLAEALTFGFGISFLLFGYRPMQAIAPASKTLTFAAYVSIAWLLSNWLFHDSLHIHVGESDLGLLLLIEYGFHLTLMIAGGIVALFFIKVTQGRAASR